MATNGSDNGSDNSMDFNSSDPASDAQDAFKDLVNADKAENRGSALLGATESRLDDEEGSFLQLIEERGPDRIGDVDALHVATVFEELSDMLEVIGNSIDTPHVEVRRQESIQESQEKNRPLFHDPPQPDADMPFGIRWQLRQHYESVINKRMRQRFEEPRHPLRKRLRSVMRACNVSKLTDKGKVQADRTLIQIMADRTVADLMQNSGFDGLLNTVEQEQSNLAKMQRSFEKCLEDEETVVALKKHIKNAKREKVAEKKDMDQMMWAIEDSSQEMIIRKEMETNYVRTYGHMLVSQTKKQNLKNEAKVEAQLYDQRLALHNEDRTHSTTMDVLKRKLQEAEANLEKWIDKYETDKDTLQGELDTLKANRARDLKRMAWLKHTNQNYWQIIKEERRLNNIIAEHHRQDLYQAKKATKIQAWWRGEMVRKQLGPYKPLKAGKKDNVDKKK